MLNISSFFCFHPKEAAMDDKERRKYESSLRERRPDLVGNPEGVRQVIRWFDRQIEDTVLKFRFDYERYASDFLTHRNNLAKYIGDPQKTFDDFKVPHIHRS